MPKSSPLISSFNAGELSPLLAGRPDLAKYANGCAKLENFIPTVQGPVARRPGTTYVAAVKDSTARTALVPFVFSNSQAFVLEFGNQYIRFYTQHGQLQVTPPTPYEIATPYVTADLFDADGVFRLSYAQSGDVIYFAHPAYPLQKLSRLSNTSWTFAAVNLTNGPFGVSQNTNQTFTIQSSGITGSVTLSSVGVPFTANSVGQLVLLFPKDLAAIKPWVPGEQFTATNPPLNAVRRSEGRNYICTTAGAPAGANIWRSGPNKPTHTSGSQDDGPGNAVDGTNIVKDGLTWQFVDSGYGIAKITGFTGVNTVTATVLQQFPAAVTTTATWQWQLGAFSPANGYPSQVTFFRERLCLGFGQVLFFSVAGDFENFAALDASGQVVADREIAVTISSDQVNQVTWLAPAQALVIGTAGAEFSCAENATNEVFSPGNVKIAQQGSDGSRAVQPLRVGPAVLAMQRSGRKLKEYRYDISSDAYVSTDLTTLAEHVTQGGITQMAWHREPYKCVWAVRSDGQLLGFTYDREQDVLGWHRHILGGGTSTAVVESIAVIPAPTRDRDEIWLIVRRTINGQSVRYIEYMTAGYQTGDAQNTAFYVDAGLAFQWNGMGLPPLALTGLSHLEGQTVQVQVNGGAHPDCVVTGGTITLQVRAIGAVVGLAYTSTVQKMRIEAGAADGTAQGKSKRIKTVVLRLLNTLGGFYGPPGGTLDEIQYRTPAVPMDSVPPLYTGDTALLPWPNGHDFDGYLQVVQTQPFPMTLVAIMPQLDTEDR